MTNIPLLVAGLAIIVTGLALTPWRAIRRRPARCDCYPLDRVQCAKFTGHRGRHTVHPADVVNAGYERKPF